MPKFPIDLPPEYHFSIDFKTYSRPNPISGQINLSSPATASLLGSGTELHAANASGDTINLPIPSNIINNLKLNWTQEAAMVGSGLTDFVGDITSGKQVSSDTIGADLGAIGIGSIKEVGGIVSRMLGGDGVSSIPGTMAGGAIGASAKTVMQKSGVALNPVLTQFFSNPDFKRHEFAWKFAPENEQETQELRNIIDQITFNALPGIATGGLFFTYPSIALLNIITGDTSPYNFQPCVVENISVNYAGAGAPSWFARTSGPTVVEMHVNFLEIILNTRDNWKTPYQSPLDFTSGLGSFDPSGFRSKIASIFGNGQL